MCTQSVEGGVLFVKKKEEKLVGGKQRGGPSHQQWPHFAFISIFFLSLSFISSPPFLLCVVVIGCLVVAIVGKARGNAFIARCRGHQRHGVAQQQQEL
jgi:hypothetical protein